MPIRKSFSCFLGAAVLLASLAAGAQTTPPAAKKAAIPDGGVPHYIKPETPEQRRERLGTNEDPGMDPEPTKVFWRFGKKYTIFKVEKQHAKYTPEIGWVRPLANTPFVREIYQENDKYIWVWNEEVDPQQIQEERQEAAKASSPWSKEDQEYFEKLRDDFEPLDVPSASKTVRFEESSSGLPTSGSWRNGAAVADMNEDGLLDLVLPPQRGPASVPSIYLGDGKGGWTRWSIKWPRGFNYGTVVAADFNKDGHLDLAFSIHLNGVAVFLGNGKGVFREVTEGLDKDFPTRRLIATDVDADGWTDLVAISEGPVGRGTQQPLKRRHGNLRAYMNRGKGVSWTGVDIAAANEYIGGDYLSAGFFNRDSFPDFVGASIYFNSVFTIYVSKGKDDYEPLVQDLLIPGRSYYQATVAARLVKGAKTDDAVISYSRYWPKNLDPNLVPKPSRTEASGIDRISFEGASPRREAIVRWEGIHPLRGMASGDFDGDGNLDLAYTVAGGRDLNILLGDGKGGFRRADVSGVELPALRMYDLVVRDLDGDRRGDVLVMFESAETTGLSPKNGSVKVYLNRGLEVGSAAK